MSNPLVHLAVFVIGMLIVTFITNRYGHYFADPDTPKLKRYDKIERLKKKLEQLELEHNHPERFMFERHRVLLFLLQYVFISSSILWVVATAPILFLSNLAPWIGSPIYYAAVMGAITGLLLGFTSIVLDERKNFDRPTTHYEKNKAKLEKQIERLEYASKSS